MKHTSKDRRNTPTALVELYAPIRNELDEVEQILGQVLASDYPFVDRLVKHGFRLGGKRLRPALVLLSAAASGSLKSEHLQLACAVELIHTATLIHDDVLDEATLRRHLETVNARWDNEASILLGDYLFARAVNMAANVNGSYACRAIGEAGQLMCQGELRQVESRGNYQLQEPDYLEIIAGKTAALTECSCRLGSYYAEAQADVCERFAVYGHRLGIAFQIADDLLDISGDEATAGKSLGTDLAKQKPTLPLIHLLSRIEGQDRETVLDILNRSDNHHRDALRPWLERFDAIDYARQQAQQYSQQAAEQVAELPSSPARDSLLGLSSFVISRQQ